MSRFLIILGLCLLILGLAWPHMQKIGLGRLPGDFIIERPQFKFYFPLTTSLLISGILSGLLWLWRKFFH